MKKKFLFYLVICGLFFLVFFGIAIAAKNPAVTKTPFEVYFTKTPYPFIHGYDADIHAKGTVPINIDDYDVCFGKTADPGDSIYNQDDKVVAHLDGDHCFPMTALLAQQEGKQYSGEIIGHHTWLRKKQKQSSTGGALFLKKKMNP